MGLKGLAKFAVLLVALLPSLAMAIASGQANAARPASTASPQSSASPTPGTDSAAHDLQPSHITVANPPPPVSDWSFHEKISWAVSLVLAIFGYVAFWMGGSLLKKIERQTRYAEIAAEAAGASAHAALLTAQAVIQSERPWILVTSETSRSTENGFSIMATNRGRTPARIISTSEQIKIALDEKRLPSPPEYKHGKAGAPLAPTILLPGESMQIKAFCRGDVRALCDSEERFKRIETWEEKIFLYGQVLYADMISPVDVQPHLTNWCCWYIHGRQSSGMVTGGTPEYNLHS
ncbi:MAG: hypothetical protein ABR906_01780 [Terracidiphilus sp.]|jgi:hypothetical protein